MNNHTPALTRSSSLVSMGDRPGEYVDADYELLGEKRGVDFNEFLAALSRHRRLISLVVLAALAAGVASIMTAEPRYRAEALVQIDPQAPGLIGGKMLEADVTRLEADRMLQTQVDVLHSRGVAGRVARDLQLSENAGFVSEHGLENVTRPQLGVAVTDELQSGLQVSSPKETRVLRLSFESRHPSLAASITNAFADTFVSTALERQANSYSHAQKHLEGQIAQTKARLASSEHSLVDYARSAGLVDASGAADGRPGDGERRSITTSSMIDLNSAYSQARAARIQAQQRWRRAQSSPALSLPEVLGNPTLQDLTRQRVELEAAFQEQRQRHKEEHPAMQQASARIAEMDQQIATLADGIRRSIGDEYAVTQGQESALLATVNQLKAATLGEQARGVRYNTIKRDVENNRNLYNSLLQRFNEISTESGATRNSISVVDRATIPVDPVYPRPVLIMALALVIGLATATLLVLFREKTNDRIRGPMDVEHEFRTPLLGVVPLLKGPTPLAAELRNPWSSVAEAHHSICIALEANAQLGMHSVILLTSSRQGEGKSTTAITIGHHLAAAGKRVLLIDGDLRRGALHRQLGFLNKGGLSDLLAINAEKDVLEQIQQSEEHGFAVIPRGRVSRNPAELLASRRFADLLGDIRANFDVIIIDGPPVMGLADAPRLAALADATLFVMEAHTASKRHMKIAMNRIAAVGANMVGVVLTKFDPSKAGRDYSYAFSYDYGLSEAESDLEEAEAKAERIHQQAELPGRGHGPVLAA